MINKQIIIDGENLDRIKNLLFEGQRDAISTKTFEAIIETLELKEQECERLNNIINEAKNSKLDLKSFLVGEAVQKEYEQQLDQLKAEIDSLKSELMQIYCYLEADKEIIDQLKAKNKESE